jgi:hypothetical protein
MIISHTHKFIFIKSRKTAGTSIEAALSAHCSGNDVVTPLGDYRVNRDTGGNWVHKAMNSEGFEQHDPALGIKNKVSPEVWATYFKFSIARNPWDRVVSDFFWKYRNDPALKPRRRFYHYLGVPFDELASTRALLSKFVREDDWQTNDRFYIIDGELCVDYVIRYESLVEGLNDVCARVGLPPVELPHLKSGIRKKSHHYSQYYDEDTRVLVAQRHQNDLRFFGYRFDKG